MSVEADLWLPLLQRLTVACPGWLVWKNADQALAGDGDIDSAASVEELGVVKDVFRKWAGGIGSAFAAVCRHLPGTHLMFAVHPRQPDKLLELDVMTKQPFRGAPLVNPSVLGPLAVMDPRGFRRLRPGAEALFLLLFNGIRVGGRPDRSTIVGKALADRLGGDWTGVTEACGVLPRRRAALAERLATAVVAGRWDPRAALGLEALSLAAALTTPAWAVQRTLVRLRLGRLCTLTRAARRGRVIRGGLQRFMEQVSAEHVEAFR